MENFADFQQRLAVLGIEHIGILEPLCYWDITYWDCCLWADDDMEVLERQIHNVLFPEMQFLWDEYCRKRGLDPKTTPSDHKWCNAKCDVQGIWGHIFNKRNVFVTSDRNFHASQKKQKLIELGQTGSSDPHPQQS